MLRAKGLVGESQNEVSNPGWACVPSTPEDAMPVFTAEQLLEVSQRILRAGGASEAEAKTVSEVLVGANLAGHDSHGVIRLPQYLNAIKQGHVKPGAKIETLAEHQAVCVLNGNWGFGQVNATHGMALACERARAYGVAAVGIQQSDHVGRLGHYPLQAAAQGMWGLMMVNGHGGSLLVTPYGGRERRLTTNQLAMAFPTGTEFPVLIDMTTSVVAEGKVRLKKNLGQPLPEGWCLDAEGNPTTDPDKFYGPPWGAILPFGGAVAYKGYALALAVDILCGAFTGATCSGTSERRGGNGIFILAADISKFQPPEAYAAEVDRFLAWVKSSAPMPGFKEVLIPGEPEFRTEKKRREEGIPVDEETWRQIQECGRQLGIEV